MTSAVAHYLENLRSNLRLDRSAESEFIEEIEAHIEDRCEELKESGLSDEEAETLCIGLLGSARAIACQIYEAHSQGTWKQALLAATPHLLFGVLFVLNWWNHVAWLSFVLGVTILAIGYGWWHGKPTWIFPWLGYSLLPVVITGILLLYLPDTLSFLTILIYIPLALWWFYTAIIQTIRKDWLLSSLMMLPIPIIVGWVLAVKPWDESGAQIVQRVQCFAPWIGLSFLAMGMTIATFIRLRQRGMRIAILAIAGFSTLAMIGFYASDKLSLPAFLVLILAMWGLFIVPALLERWLKNGKRRVQEPDTRHA